jgi:hypothetical protein
MGNCFERSKMRKAAISLLIPFMLGAGALAQPDHLRLGEIEFYGYAGLDLDARRAALPVHEGDDVSWDRIPAPTDRIKNLVQANSVEAVCCDNKNGLMIYMIYVGLPGKSARYVAYQPAPNGLARFPQAVTELEQQWSRSWKYSSESPSGGRNLREVMPCTRLLRLEMVLPSGVRGPVLFLAIGVRLRFGGHVGGPCVSLCVMAGADSDPRSDLSILWWGQAAWERGYKGCKWLKRRAGFCAKGCYRTMARGHDGA